VIHVVKRNNAAKDVAGAAAQFEGFFPPKTGSVMNPPVGVVGCSAGVGAWAPAITVLASDMACAISAKYSGAICTVVPFRTRLTWIVPHVHRLMRTPSVLTRSVCGPHVGLTSESDMVGKA